MMKLERAVIVRRTSSAKALLVTWIAIALLGAGYEARDVVGPLAFKTDDLVVTATATVGTTLGVTGLSTLSGGYDSTGGNALVGKFTGTIQTDTSTGTVNDFVINAATTTLQWSSGVGNVTYNGFKCGAADCGVGDNGRRIRVIVRTGGTGNTAVLAADAAASVATNRIYPGNMKWVLKGTATTSTAAAELEYDGTSLRWRVLSVSTERIDQAMEFVSTISADGGVSAGPIGFTATGTAGLTFTNTGGAGHIRSTSAGGFVPALTACGGGSPTITGTDIAGTVTEGTTATGCVITFSLTYGTAPACVVTTQSTLVAFAYVVSANAITITNTSNSGDIINYICIGTS